MKPITIIGGGLAGLSLGIGLRHLNVPVTVMEAGTYPRHRVCGEFILGVSNQTLQNLGIHPVFTRARHHQTLQWFSEDRPLYRTKLQQPALGFSRYTLDQLLVELLQSRGATLRTGCRHTRKAVEGQVWATGRIPVSGGRWIGLKAHLSGVDLGADLEMHLGTSGYVGMAGVEEGKVNICGLFKRRKMRAKGSNLLSEYLKINGLHSLVDRMGKGALDESSFLGVSGFEPGPQPIESDVCAIGDASSMIPPFTGNGMSMAFEAAEMAAGVLESYARGHLPWKKAVQTIRELQNKRFRYRLLTAGILHRFLLSDSGRSLLGTLARLNLLPFHFFERRLS